MTLITCQKCGYKSKDEEEMWEIETPSCIFWLCLDCATNLELMIENFVKEQQGETK